MMILKANCKSNLICYPDRRSSKTCADERKQHEINYLAESSWRNSLKEFKTNPLIHITKFHDTVYMKLNCYREIDNLAFSRNVWYHSNKK